MDRSILRELCSWSSSFTNLSFYTGKDAKTEQTTQKHNTAESQFVIIWVHKPEAGSADAQLIGHLEK